MTMKTHELWTPVPPWLGQFVAEYDATSNAVWTLRGERAGSGVFIGTLRGRRMRRREGVFDQFGALLQFPHYFGENWNAFADCLRDLDWLHANGFLLVMIDAVEVLADGDPDEFELLLKVLTDAGESWAHGDEFHAAMPFHVLFHATPEQAAGLQARLAALRLVLPIVDLPRK
jgi:hypothetical protein